MVERLSSFTCKILKPLKWTSLTSKLERTRDGVILFGMTATFCWIQYFIRIWEVDLECRLAISTTTSSSSNGIGSKVLKNRKFESLARNQFPNQHFRQTYIPLDSYNCFLPGLPNGAYATTVMLYLRQVSSNSGLWKYACSSIYRKNSLLQDSISVKIILISPLAGLLVEFSPPS